jgi:predicted O-methyltransferase YrrM
MIKAPPEFRALTHELSTSTWTLGTIGVLFESGIADELKEWRSLEDLATRCPALSVTRIERCLALAATFGVVVMEGSRYRLAEGVAPFVAPPMRASILGDIRSTLMQALAMLDASAAPRVERGWRHTNPALLQAQGDASAAMPGIFKSNLLPSMGDLAARLERQGARLLDVGVGVGSLAIAMCRAFPQLHVVGVDSFDVPLAMARANVTRAGLEGRIELRLGTIEDLGASGSFDLAWLPTFFIDEAVLPAATARVHAALRPGGWILFPTGANPAATERQRAHFALVTDLWGGPALSIERAESLLNDAGFGSIRPLPGPAWAPAMVVAQRDPS